MKQFIDFKVIITRDEDGVFVATCPSIPGCHSQGMTYEEAEANIKEAIELCLEVAKNDPNFRSGIEFARAEKSQFVGISDISVSKPAYL